MILSHADRRLLQTAFAIVETDRAILKSDNDAEISKLEQDHTDLTETYETLRDSVTDFDLKTMMVKLSPRSNEEQLEE